MRELDIPAMSVAMNLQTQAIGKDISKQSTTIYLKGLKQSQHDKTETVFNRINMAFIPGLKALPGHCTVHVYNTLLLCITRPSNCNRHQPICKRHQPPTHLEPESQIWGQSGQRIPPQIPPHLPCKRAKTVISEFKWFKCALTPTAESRDLGQSEASILTNQRPVFRPIRG